MGEQHDDWLKNTLGIDVDQLRKAAGGGGIVGGGNPLDPSFQAAVVDTATKFVEGTHKGQTEQALDTVNSLGGQIAGGPTTFLGNVIRAEVTGDASQLAPVKLPTIPDTNDPNAQATAVAQTEGLVKSVVDPIGFMKDGAVAAATVLVTGDPEKVGEGFGRSTVIIGTTLAGAAGELGAAGEAGAAGGADAGAAGGAVDSSAAGGAAVDSGAASGAGNVGEPLPFGVFADDPPPPSLPVTQPAPVVVGDTPAPVSGFDSALPPPPAEISPAAESVAPPGPPAPDLTPPSRLPGLDDPAPAPNLNPADFPFPGFESDGPNSAGPQLARNAPDAGTGLPATATDEPLPSTQDAPESGPVTEQRPTFPNDPPNPFEGQPPVRIEDPEAAPPSTQDPAPSTEETPPATEQRPTFPNDPPNPFEGQPPVRIEDPEAPPPSTQDPAPSTEQTTAPATEETPAPATEETPAPATEETPAPATEETPAPQAQEEGA
jgi:hypothetical protein